MVEDAGDLAKHGANPLGALGNLDIEQLLYGARVAELVGHHADVVEPVKVWKCLGVVLVFDKLLCPAVQQTDVGVCSQNLLAIELENESQYAVSSGMLWTKVDGEVTKRCLLARAALRQNLSRRAFVQILDGVGADSGGDGRLALHLRVCPLC